MVNRDRIALVLGSLLIGFVGLHTLAAPPKPPKVNWYTDIYAAHKASLKSQKPMLLIFHADWCGYCKKLEKTTLSTPRMVNYINASFVPVHLDLDKEKRIARILEVKSVPCSIVLSPNADLLGRLVGYVEADQYRRVLERTQQIHARIKKAQTRTITSRETPRRQKK